MTKINSIWQELENDNSFTNSLLLRRFSSSILLDAFVALRQPEKIRCIAIGIDKNYEINLSGYGNLKDIKLELIPNENNSSRKFLLVLLANQQHLDVFAALCEDLMSSITNISDEQNFIKEFLNRLLRWKLLFEKASLQGLLAEEQRGLYGELFFLRAWLNNSSDLFKPVQAWLGPDKDVRDFQFQGFGIEVKTSHGNNHQKIHVTGERQLDTSMVNSLFLFHLSLEVQQLNGETLNQMVDSISAILNSDQLAKAQFNAKLLQGGYFPNHRHLYEKTGYQIRKGTFYFVKDNFPRIEEKDLRKGVGEVKYSIILSEYTNLIVPDSTIFEMIN